MSLVPLIMNIGFSTVVLALVLGLLGWAIHSSRYDDAQGARATRGRPMPRPSFPTPRVTFRRPSPGGPHSAGRFGGHTSPEPGAPTLQPYVRQARQPAGDDGQVMTPGSHVWSRGSDIYLRAL
jgi:hypothetical protein